ncbi:MAG: NADH-quinone oxidoreductase subunit NuoG [Actinobacteria bacterium]|nr:NADH-quinone oxidoreductase subunit NuoG [Actinomycetota bacterium]
MPELVRITIDGREVEVPAGDLLIKAAQDQGTYIPRFCWHERMRPVGMCRMCLVEVETERGKALVTACTYPVAEGISVETSSDVARRSQEAVLEFLLANHPLDCPVCDKGGECPLQDQALSHGPGESRFVEIKRSFEKPIPISDLVLLDRERCILCDRCTRFSDEISGDPLIQFLDRGNKTEVNTFPDHPFSSYFSGNTVQICPVGALTARPYRFRARPWDLAEVESSSLFDTAHPRIAIHASQNEVLRHQGVDHDGINHGWLSDKARFGFQYLGSEERLTRPLIRRGSDFEEIGWSEALDIVADRLGLIKGEGGGEALAVIGGAQGSNEDAYSLSKMARVALGTNNVDCRMEDTLASQFLAGTVDRARIDDLDDADTILVWGPDLKEEHPTLYLRVRRAAQDLGATLVLVHPWANGLDDRAAHKLTYRPGGGFDLLAEVQAGRHPEVSTALGADKVVALVGMASHADGPHLAEAVAALARDAAASARILPLAGRANTYGALDMGLAPDLLPGRVGIDGSGNGWSDDAWGPTPRNPGKGTGEILSSLIEGDIRGLLLVGADPLRDVPHPLLTADALRSLDYAVSIDLFLNDSNRGADVVLPALGFAEKEGTATNVEGRVQKLNKIRPGPGQAREDWSIIEDIATRMGAPLGLASAEGINKEISTVAPVYQGITWDHLEWDSPDGALAPLEGSSPLNHIPVALVTGNRPGPGLGLHISRVMYDDGVRLRHSPALRPLAPGPVAMIHPDDAASLQVAPGDRVTLRTEHGEGRAVVVVDPAATPRTVRIPFNQADGPRLGTAPVVSVEKAGT